MDPAKLKVAELRSELQERGLDTKGNKPVLVKRLKKALEAELETELPDTSIADTSTEDCGSQDDECMVEAPAKSEQPETESEAQVEIAVQPEPESLVPEEKIEPEKPEVPEEQPVCEVKPETEPDIQDEVVPVPEVSEEPMDNPVKEEPEFKPESELPEQATEVTKDEPSAVSEVKPEQNGDTNGDTEEDSCEPKTKKSRWGADESSTIPPDNEAVTEECKDNKDQPKEERERGDKRKHSSPSPERNQRQRSKSPIREDEPVVDADKVQLSWCDSDLHLQIDKTNFLSAKPLHDGLFGYIWSGARATHGVKSGVKACYEVKIIEELKFEDILTSSPNPDRRDARGHRRDRRDDRERSRAKSSDNGSERSEKTNITDKSDQSKADQESKATETEAKTTPTETENSMETEESVESTKTLETSEEAVAVKMEVETTVVEKSEEKTDEIEASILPKTEDKEKTDETTATDEKESTKSGDTSGIGEPELVKIAPHLIRLGWSDQKANLQLGEDALSFGLESSGKFYVNSTAIDTECTFKVGDVVKMFVDMTTFELVFAVNGIVGFKYQIELSADENKEEFVLFPHILTRNLSFEVNLGDSDLVLCDTTTEGFEDYTFVSKLDAEQTVSGPKTVEKREDCQLILMVGLPAAGKTHWVREHIKTSEKKYLILGSTFLLDRMTVNGKSISTGVHQSRIQFMYGKIQKALNKLCDLAALRRRDCIIDQTNVFQSTVRRKLRSFLGFKRHAVIIVNEDEEQEKRMKQQAAKIVRELSNSELDEMKGFMFLPKVDENLELVTFVSLPEDKAREQVQKYNQQRRTTSGSANSMHGRDFKRNDRNRSHQRGSGGGGGPRRDYQQRNNYRDRPYHVNRFDRNYRQNSGSGGGGGSWRPSGGGGNWMNRDNDRRDNRGPRDWHRNNSRSGGMPERTHNRGGSNRDHRTHSSGGGGNYNRNRNQGSGGGGGGGGRWSGGGQSGGWSGSQGGGSGSGSWNSSQGQDWNSGWNQSQGSWNQNQWKYGGGYNQGGYSQYPQNWNSYYGGNNFSSQDWSGSNSGGGHGQSGASVQTTSSTTNVASSNSSYAPSSMMAQQQQQAAWAQYTQQYTQDPTSNTNSQK